jgi:hypothetical protein
MLLDALITKGQGIFFLIAMAGFGVLMMFLYKQDKKRDAKYFKGTWMIFVVLMLIVTFLFLFVIMQSPG